MLRLTDRAAPPYIVQFIAYYVLYMAACTWARSCAVCMLVYTMPMFGYTVRYRSRYLPGSKESMVVTCVSVGVCVCHRLETALLCSELMLVFTH